MRQARAGPRRDHVPRRPRHAAGVLLAVVAGGVLALPAELHSQLERLPEQGGRTVSLGQPPRTHFFTGFSGGTFQHAPSDRQLGVHAFLGVQRPLLNPVAGLASAGLEFYGGVRGDHADGGVRGILRIPYIGLGAGVDYNFRDGDAAALLTAFGPVRRGGIVAPGGLLRIDVQPQHRSVTVGVSLPVADRFSGRGRPLREHVVVGARFQPLVAYHITDAELEAVLDSIARSAERIRVLVAPFLDQDARTGAQAEQRTAGYLQEVRGHLAKRSFEEEVRHFHAEVERAFALATGDERAAPALAACAREVILAEVLLPYNRLLGRKKRRDTLADLAIGARGRFSRAVIASGLAAPEHADRVDFVFQRLTQMLDDVRRTAAHEWNDARLAWLPLQYALLPEQHDEREELDALLARATGVAFTRGNDIRYVANLQFHWELLRSIRQTQDYHVLWVHDFPALNPDGELDGAALDQMIDGYLTALAERVERYDATGTLPTYFIFIDQFYYDSRRSRDIMSVLADPLHARPALPRASAEAVQRLDRSILRLRTAVAGSRVLQAEARQYGERWLRNRISVHVSVTNRTDPSFWGGALIGTLFSYPDNVMRDHRKLAFRDVSEADPSAGVAVLTGMGVGDQYLTDWEDRSLVLAGPILRELKGAARELLLSQGLRPHEVPAPLREDAPAEADPLGTWAAPPAGDAQGGVRAGELHDTDAMVLLNGTGYLDKPINVAKAVLYSLLPPGSVMKIPDSLWNSTFFGSLLAGASLRGCTVSIMAPAPANAPSSGFPQLARAHELLARLLLLREVLEDPMRAAGGELHVGLYALPPDAGGFDSRVEDWVQRVGGAPAIRALGPARAHLLPVLAAAVESSDHTADRDAVVASRLAPRLHHKVQYLATGDAWDAITASPLWPEFAAAYLRYRKATYTGSEMELDGAHAPTLELARIARRLAADAGIAPAGASYALVGSQNMDYRGMFMDGEVVVLFAGAESLVALIDLLFVEGNTTWLADRPSLHRLLPPPSELKRRLARLTKDAM